MFFNPEMKNGNEIAQQQSFIITITENPSNFKTCKQT